MSNVFNLRDAEKKIEEVNIPLVIKHHLNENHQSFNRMSRLLGKESNFLIRKTKSKNSGFAVLYALSIHLQTNLFEYIQNQLPENIRPTRQEKQLQQQIDELKKQIADITKERDLLKEIVMKR
ncbi:MAG TPA: hypothetical protein PL045_08415 [Chitinophagaceae bacterium]|nr:hypothetical protein [Chitinophagaceae bacterium]